MHASLQRARVHKLLVAPAPQGLRLRTVLQRDHLDTIVLVGACGGK